MNRIKFFCFSVFVEEVPVKPIGCLLVQILMHVPSDVTILFHCLHYFLHVQGQQIPNVMPVFFELLLVVEDTGMQIAGQVFELFGVIDGIPFPSEFQVVEVVGVGRV